MMTCRLRSLAFVGLIILIGGIAFYAFTKRSQAAEQIFPATINRDCAPWDGSAFTVSIPMKDMGISISIYQAPDIKLPATFSFPDDTMSVGNALLIMPIDSPKELTGKVSFQRVQQGSPVEGTFDITAVTGERFKGKFIAEWGNEIVYCG